MTNCTISRKRGQSPNSENFRPAPGLSSFHISPQAPFEGAWQGALAGVWELDEATAWAWEASKTAGLGSITKSCTARHALGKTALSRRYELLGVAGSLLPNERVAKCRRSRVKLGPVKGVYYQDTNKGGFSNLMCCGSVWTCPFCAPKITEQRRQELTDGVNGWQDGGGVVGMLTLTIRHREGERCKVVLAGLLEAAQKFWRYRAGVALRVGFGIVGRVRSLEVTHGGNGWHAHLHVLVFLQSEPGPDEAEAFRAGAAAHWSHVLGKDGRYASARHGVDFRLGDADISDYVTKYGSDWSVAHELAKSHVKTGKKGGRTPFMMLADNQLGDQEAGRLFVEYAEAFKGKRQLVWSKGSRDLLGLNVEEKDEDIAEAAEGQEPVTLVEFDYDAWRLVLANDIRAELTMVLDTGDQVLVKQMLITFGIEAEYPNLYDRCRGPGEAETAKLFGLEFVKQGRIWDKVKA